jgi:hypothetical protein
MLLIASLLVACWGPPYAQSALTTQDYRPSGRSPEQIEIYHANEQRPGRPYKAIGTITTDWSQGGRLPEPKVIVDLMRREASRIGADAIIDVEFVRPGMVGKGLGSGTAVVFLDR